MSSITALLTALGLGALLFADALLQSERMARAAHPLRSLWWAHAGHVLLAQIALLAFGWTRLHFSPASAPAPWELLLLAVAWSVAHLAFDILLIRRRLLGELLKALSLLPIAWLLQMRHGEWTALAQGPILFLGQSVPIASFALNLTLFFGLAWTGLAWRERSLALTRLSLSILLALAVGLGAS